MIDPITGAGSTPPVDLLSSQVPGGTLGKDEFLELLIAQLQNQDPLSPMEADQLAVQLAEFSGVEQLIQLNENFQSLEAFNGFLAGSVATTTAVGMIGKNVEAAVSDLVFDGTGNASVDVTMPPTGGQATVRLFDAFGEEIGAFDLGSVSPGRQTLDLSPIDAQVAPGTYSISVEVFDPTGEAIPVPTTITGPVTGVRYDENGPVLVIGNAEFPLASVLSITS